MTAVYSTTNDSLYSFFVPITVWCWEKLGVSSCIIYPENIQPRLRYAIDLACDRVDTVSFYSEKIKAPEHKMATYMQCARIYAAAISSVPPQETLCTSDIDMLLFKKPEHCFEYGYDFTVFGSDLVPPKQFPVCYVLGQAEKWKDAFEMGNKSCQQLLDELLGDIEAEHFRGNYWGKDQETLFNVLNTKKVNRVGRAREGTQFARHRLDRDDAYILDRLSPEDFDYHMNRPGYTEKNINIILIILRYHYPEEDFTWIIEYHKKYVSLL